jgi:hypothetical protein
MRAVDVSKSLDRKLKLFGYEVLDVLTIFLTLSVLNLLFGQSGMSLLLVWTPSVALAVVLRLGKRGKPEKYLLHWLRYQVKPGIYSAFPEPTDWQTPPSLRRRASR